MSQGCKAASKKPAKRHQHLLGRRHTKTVTTPYVTPSVHRLEVPRRVGIAHQHPSNAVNSNMFAEFLRAVGPIAHDF